MTEIINQGNVSQSRKRAEFGFEVPDIWFDLIARLLPGTGFVLSIILFNPYYYVGLPAWLVIFLGYFVGLFTQPIASILAVQFLKKSGAGIPSALYE